MTTTPFDKPKTLMDRVLFPALKRAYEQGRDDEMARPKWPVRGTIPTGPTKFVFVKEGRYVDAPDGWDS